MKYVFQFLMMFFFVLVIIAYLMIIHSIFLIWEFRLADSDTIIRVPFKIMDFFKKDLIKDIFWISLLMIIWFLILK